MSVTAVPVTTGIAQRVSREAWVARIGVLLLVAWLVLSIALPLWALLSKSFQNANGEFIGLTNYIRYFSTPSLFNSIFNSVWVAVVTTVIVIPLGVRLCLCADAQPDAVQGAVLCGRHAAAVCALAALRDLAHLPVR